MVLKKILDEFPGRNWSLASVKRLLHQIDATGSPTAKPAVVDVVLRALTEMPASWKNWH